MADIRLTSASIGAVAPRPQTPRTEAVRAAQRAFFQAALSGQAPGPSPATEAAAVQQPPAPIAAGDGSRMLRPGSLLDIKV